MTEQFFAKTSNQSTSVQTHSKAWKCVYEKIAKEKHNTKKREKDKCIHQERAADFMEQQFVIPHLKLDSREQLSGTLENPPVQKIMSSPSPVLAMAQYQGEMFGKYVKNTEVKVLERDKKLTHFSKKLQDVTTEKDQLQHEMMRLSAKNDVLIQKSEADKAYAEEQLAKTKANLQELKTTLKPKNVKWHEETKLIQISALKKSIVNATEEKEKEKAEIVKETVELRETIKCLEGKLKHRKRQSLRHRK